MIKSLLFFILIFQLSTAFADNAGARGKVLKVTGDVQVIDADGKKRKVENADEPINEMDTVVTRPNARIVMRFDDGSLSVLDEKSRLRIEKTNWFSYLGGRIYFTFKKVFDKNERHVKTRSATIGVRGTTFIINKDVASDAESVALKDGLLQIESTGAAFEIHRQKELSEFEKYQQEQQAARQQTLDEFSQYKKQVMKEFVEYRQEFTLKPNRVISLTGNRVDEKAMSAATRAEFKDFEYEAGDLIKQFRSGKL